MKTRTNKRAVSDSDEDLPFVSSRSQQRMREKRKIRMKKSAKGHAILGKSTSSDESYMQSPGSSRGRKSAKSKDFDNLTPSYPESSEIPSSPPLVNFFTPSSDIPKNFCRGNNFESRFKTSIVHKQFVYEKTMDMFYYQNSPLQNLFESCGISSMVFPPTVAYPRLVQQFYTNFENNGDYYTSFVKGKTLFFTVVDLGSILNIPSTGPCPFTLKGAAHTPFSPLEQLHIVMNNTSLDKLYTPKTVDVSPIACVLHKVVRYNLLPRLGGGADFTYQDLVLVAMILKGVSFNLSLMMLHNMSSCIRQNKKCLPYSGFLTKLFQHFQISFENEASVPLNESIDSVNLKLSHVSLINGMFVRIPVDTLPTLDPPTSSTQPPVHHPPEIMNLLSKILTNQESMQGDISDIKGRLSALEKGKLPMGADDVKSLYARVEDEFIDLQAGFELHTTAMVEALQRKMNRNTCQLSQELKFVSNQVGVLGRFTARRTNEIGAELNVDPSHSPVPEWPQCNWMAEFSGDFMDLEAPPQTYIPRPPRFAHEMTMAEKVQRLVHRRYFTRRQNNPANIVDLD